MSAVTPFTQHAILAALGVGGRVELPSGECRIDQTLSVPRSCRLIGPEYGSATLRPVTGMAVPVVDLLGKPGGVGAAVESVGIIGGGASGVPAIVSRTYHPLVERVRLEQWAGHGIDLTGPYCVHSALRDSFVYGCGGDGVTLGATVQVAENSAASGNAGSGWVLTRGTGTLRGCSADNNAQHGVLITAGNWIIEGCYFENNRGDAINVTGGNVIIRASHVAGTIRLDNCTYQIDGINLDAGAGVIAGPNARLIGEPRVMTNTNRPRRFDGVGGSEAAAALLGWPAPVQVMGLAHGCQMGQAFRLYGSNASVTSATVDEVPCLSIGAQWAYVQTAQGWSTASLTPGPYRLRALVRNAEQVSGAANLVWAPFTSRQVSVPITTQTPGWEWVEMPFEQTAERKAQAGPVIVQRTKGSVVEVAEIQFVPVPR